ncbi:MAG: carbonic anhydrase [Nitrospiraceae bacterium]|jgi:carbonic anhydrase|nr:carbonic anhydrase [Nitrospiraceae bacterium]
MDKLYKGLHHFRESFFRKEEEFFQRISSGQNPEVLFITCSDSRIDPNLVTQSRPGELFIVRNVGNIVPPHDAIRDKNSVAAALEYAVSALKVKDIVICGHSNCGALQALFSTDIGIPQYAHLRNWLSLANPLHDIMKQYYGTRTKAVFARIAEEENVLLQLENIQTYPFIVEALQAGTLRLHGWYYDIGNGRVYAYNPETESFDPLH